MTFYVICHMSLNVMKWQFMTFNDIIIIIIIIGLFASDKKKGYID